MQIVEDLLGGYGKNRLASGRAGATVVLDLISKATPGDISTEPSNRNPVWIDLEGDTSLVCSGTGSLLETKLTSRTVDGCVELLEGATRVGPSFISSDNQCVRSEGSKGAPVLTALSVLLRIGVATGSCESGRNLQVRSDH